MLEVIVNVACNIIIIILFDFFLNQFLAIFGIACEQLVDFD